MNPLKRIENMAEYGFADLDLEETANMHEDALALMDEIKQLQAENKGLRVLVDSAKPIVEVYPTLTDGSSFWKKDWLKDARKILKQ